MTFDDFLSALLAFESGWDRERYDAGRITDAQLDTWARGKPGDYYPGKTSWSQLSDAEWSEMAYRSMNTLGFVGFQFGEALLIDLGYYKDDVYYGNGASTNTWDGTWTGKNGVNSLDDFKTKAAQDVAIREAFGHNLKIIRDGLSQSGTKLEDLLGQSRTYTENGVEKTVTLTLTGILAAAHLRGAFGTLDFLRSGAVSRDEFGTSILSYVSQFGGFDAPTVEALIGQAPTPGGGQPEADITRDTADVVLDWNWGQQAVKTDFDPKEDTIFVGWFGADAVTITQSGGDVVITIAANNQSLTLKGVTLDQLSPSNFRIMDDGLRAKITAAIGKGDTTKPDAKPDPKPDAKPDPDPSPDPRPDPKPDPEPGPTVTEVKIDWAWGRSETIDNFDTAKGVIHIGWFNADQIEVSQQGTALVISIPSNNQSVTLTNVTLTELSMANFDIKDSTARAEIAGQLGVDPVTPTPPVTPNPDPDGNPDPDPAPPAHPHHPQPPTTPTPEGEAGYPVVYDTGTAAPGSAIAGGGTRYAANPGGADIKGFDTARDQIDFGSASVHSLIVTKTPKGELVLDSPWSGAMQIVVGSDIKTMTPNVFGVVGNEHLRQDLGGVLSWEQGVGPRDADTVYVRSHEYGVHEVVNDFNPATDKISFLYFGTRERLSVQDTDKGLVISSLPTDQSVTLTGIKKADLRPSQLEFHHDQVMEDNLEAPFGFDQEDVTLVSRAPLLTPQAPTGEGTDGHQTRPGQQAAEVDGFVFAASDAGQMAGEADALSPEMLAEFAPAPANADTAAPPDNADLLSEPAMACIIDDMFAL